VGIGPHTALHQRVVGALHANLHAPRVRPVLRVALGRLEQRLEAQSAAGVHDLARHRVRDRVLDADAAALGAAAVLVEVHGVQALEVAVLGVVGRGLEGGAVAAGDGLGDVGGVDDGAGGVRGGLRFGDRRGPLLQDLPLVEVVEVREMAL